MIEKMDLDNIVMGVFLLSPFWIPVVLYFIWRKSIYSKFKFVSFSWVMFSCAIVIADLAVYIPTNLELEHYRLSGDLCKPSSVCGVAEFVHKNFSIVVPFMYCLFIIIIIAMMRAWKPRWLGFGLRKSIGAAG